jgi:transposase
MPALQTYIIEPIWEQFAALLPEREVDHPLGCHKPRVPDRVVFEKLVQVLVFGCAYWRIADESCSDTTLRRRRDEWIEGGVMERLPEMALSAYERIIGLELDDVSVDGCITKAPCGGEKAGKSPVDRGKRGTKHNAHKKLMWCTERQGRVIDYWVAFSEVVIVMRRLIREAWSRYRWEARPSRRP